MKLIGEQVKYLRERRKELLGRLDEYQSYVKSRERTSVDDIGCPMIGDFNDDMHAARSLAEQNEVNTVLSRGRIVLKRDYQRIDIGTGFYLSFSGKRDKIRRLILTDSSSPSLSLQTVSLDTDLGQVVLGKKAGEEVTYQVRANGRMVHATIQGIDEEPSHYERFIREVPTTKRMSQLAKSKLKELKENDLEEYQSWHQLTKSQMLLVHDELAKISIDSKDYSDIRMRSFYESLLDGDTAEVVDDNSIGIGSIVTLELIDEMGNTIQKTFEMINRAVSSELESDYVERISPLGIQIYGLKPTDTFEVRRNHLPRLHGKIVSVYNGYGKKLVR